MKKTYLALVHGVPAPPAGVIDAPMRLLDDFINDLDLAFTQVLRGDRQSPRYRRYLPVPKSQLIRMGLGTELGRVRSWPDSLASEPEAELKALGERLPAIIAQGDQALEQRRKAAATRADHRVRNITSLGGDINNARMSLFGTLTQKAAAARLPRNWPDRFFQHASRSAQPEVEPARPRGDRATRQPFGAQWFLAPILARRIPISEWPGADYVNWPPLCPAPGRPRLGSRRSRRRARPKCLRQLWGRCRSTCRR